MLSVSDKKRPAFCSAGRPVFFPSLPRPWVCLSLASALFLLLGSTGCENSGTGVVDSAGEPPFISASRLDPDTIDLRQIAPSGDLYPVAIVVRADVTTPSTTGAPIAVTARIIPPDADFPSAEAGLVDDGRAPDSLAGDGTYAGVLEFNLLATQAGRYRLLVTARSAEGYESVSHERLVPITRLNAAPVLSDLSAPDTVDAPTTQKLLIVMSVRADDPDGLEDIQEVYFRSLDSSDPQRKFFLLDDGDLAGSGDRVAGDGVFSIIVELLPGTPARTFRFAFQAQDTFGDTSATILHSLTVR